MTQLQIIFRIFLRTIAERYYDVRIHIAVVALFFSACLNAPVEAVVIKSQSGHSGRVLSVVQLYEGHLSLKQVEGILREFVDTRCFRDQTIASLFVFNDLAVVSGFSSPASTVSGRWYSLHSLPGLSDRFREWTRAAVLGDGGHVMCREGNATAYIRSGGRSTRIQLRGTESAFRLRAVGPSTDAELVAVLVRTNGNVDYLIHSPSETTSPAATALVQALRHEAGNTNGSGEVRNDRFFSTTPHGVVGNILQPEGEEYGTANYESPYFDCEMPAGQNTRCKVNSNAIYYREVADELEAWGKKDKPNKQSTRRK